MSAAAAERPDSGREGEERGAPAPTLGAALRAAREAAGLSVADVAQALKYAPRQIERLEADDYAALPGAVFVRGFVRNYARLVKIDPTPLLAQLSAVLPPSPVEVRPPANMGAAEDGRRRGERRLALLAGVIAVMAGLALLARFFWPGDTLVSHSGNSPPAPALPAPAQAAAPLEKDGSFAEREEALPPSAEPARATIELSFADRSWVEISDGQGKVLHRAENAAGSALELSGLPPFDLVIGNAKAVTLLYRGEPVDLAPYTRAEVARLKLE